MGKAIKKILNIIIYILGGTLILVIGAMACALIYGFITAFSTLKNHEAKEINQQVITREFM